MHLRRIFVGSFVASFVDKVPDKARDKVWVAGGSPPWGWVREKALTCRHLRTEPNRGRPRR